MVPASLSCTQRTIDPFCHTRERYGLPIINACCRCKKCTEEDFVEESSTLSLWLQFHSSKWCSRVAPAILSCIRNTRLQVLIVQRRILSFDASQFWQSEAKSILTVCSQVNMTVCSQINLTVCTLCIIRRLQILGIVSRVPILLESPSLPFQPV